MISVTSKMSAGIAGFGVNSAALFQSRQMEMLGQFGIKTVRDRVSQGIGSDDSAMRPLSAKPSAVKIKGRIVRTREPYAAWKVRHGLQPIRDLLGTGKEGGHMLDNLSVRLATQNSVKMAFTSRSARSKAASNERLSPFLSFSDSDSKKIAEYAASLFHSRVSSMGQELFTSKSLSFWL